MAKGLPENRDYIALALRHLRAELNLTQDELSLHSKITIQSISVLERGVGNPVLTNLEKLAKALQTTVPDLINLGKALKMAKLPRLCDIYAENVKLRRVELGLSRQDLASKTGVSVTYVWNIESKKNPASLDKVEEFALALDTTTQDLLKLCNYPAWVSA